MNNATVVKPKLKGFGLIRDKNGKPRIDGDPRNLHPAIKELMTSEEYFRAIEEYENESA